ncbi:MAG TPA: PLP-dependent aminotransferase family protein, partial [Phenylobacterium sp.]
MPATRRAKAVFGVSRNTLAEIYERLALEGLVVSRQGSGAYVAAPLPQPSVDAPERRGHPDARLNPVWLDPLVTRSIGFWAETADAAGTAGPAVDFRPALVDWSLFPFDLFRKVSAKQLRALERRPASLKSPQGNQGSYALRRALTQHIGLTRAVVCRPQDVLVTSGAQQAFDLLARTLVIPGKTVVAVEDPGYPPLRAAFLAAGARLAPTPVDGEGLVLDRLPPDATVICVCPSHQFPLGATMSQARRRALLELARARGAVIVEDDYDGEFRFDDAPIEALRGADAGDVVFYVGTFSKCMLPALRLGFVAAPQWAMPALVLAKNCQDWHCSTPLQLGVAAFIAEGHLARHVRRMREAYGARRARILEVLRG